MEPLSAVIFSAIFLNEIMGTMQIIGALLILGGAAFGELFHQKIMPTNCSYTGGGPLDQFISHNK
jgi:hypothetical protein